MATRQSVVDKYNKFIYGLAAPSLSGFNDLKNKELNVRHYTNYFIDRLLEVFKWEGLPESLPSEYLELQALCQGFTYVTDKNKDGEIRAYYGGLGEGMTPYYFPKKVIITNPWDNTYETLDIEEDGVILKNDLRLEGVLPLINKYASLLAENELSLRLLIVNTRHINLITAKDDDVYLSAKKYLEKVEGGELGVIMGTPLLDGIQTDSMSNAAGTSLTQLLETEQYLKAALWQELGLESNHNMKRESLNEAETSMNNKTTLPLIDNMLRCRREFAEKLNAKYGLNVTVELNSAWAIQHMETLEHAVEDELDDEIIEAEEVKDEINDKEENVDEQGKEEVDKEEDEGGDDDERTKKD